MPEPRSQSRRPRIPSLSLTTLSKEHTQPGAGPSSNRRLKELRTAAERLRPSPIAIARRAYVGAVPDRIKPLSRADRDSVRALIKEAPDRAGPAPPDGGRPGRLTRTRPGGRSRRHR
jgi:hypothetical protein